MIFLFIINNQQTFIIIKIKKKPINNINKIFFQKKIFENKNHLNSNQILQRVKILNEEIQN